MVKRFELLNNLLVESKSAESSIIVCVNPDTSEKNTLISDFSIDEHTLLSALDPDEVPRIEIDVDSLCLIWKRPMNYSGQYNFYFNVTSSGLFLFKNRLAVVLTEDVSIAPTGARKVYRLDSVLNVLLAFLYETIHHYIEHLKVIKMLSRELQEEINTSMENKHLIKMFNLSESLVYYANAINGNNTVLTRLRIYAEKANFGLQILDLLDDLIIENNQCFKQAEIYSTVFSGLMDARGTLVNNNMNVLLKNLTVINVVFLPLTLIASIGGMSEFSMWTTNIDWRISYSLFFVAMVVIGWITAFFLGKMDFARSKRSRRKTEQKDMQ
ncbi:magnesium transporter CorA family protein [bacterium]|nr:magnesium transporter CorA family protein [bacterium]